MPESFSMFDALSEPPAPPVDDVPDDPPQPGADEDGFGGDAPDPAPSPAQVEVDEELTEEMLRHAEIPDLDVDEYGRLRVRDEDTGHERTIPAHEWPHGRYVALDEPASDAITGEPLPPVYAGAHESLSTESGQ